MGLSRAGSERSERSRKRSRKWMSIGTDETGDQLEARFVHDYSSSIKGVP